MCTLSSVILYCNKEELYRSGIAVKYIPPPKYTDNGDFYPPPNVGLLIPKVLEVKEDIPFYQNCQDVQIPRNVYKEVYET
jgi:hypothetical protein